MTAPVALITGGARRIGAATTRALHQQGYRVIIHYRQSAAEAEALAGALNRLRADSARTLAADLNQQTQVKKLAQAALNIWQRVDALINNASSFYPTPIAEASESQWDDLLASNLKAPFFLAQALAPALTQQGGCIINMADIHAERPLKNHSIYCIAKAGNAMLTKTLAKELAPNIRVNGISPGAILWPEQNAALEANAQQNILDKIALKRTGEAEDIARTIVFLLAQAPYITGQIIAVDGGRTLNSD